MATKVYGISGYTTTCLRIPAGDGKAYLECEFTRGCPNGAYSRPATYVTSDKTVQSIIEHSPYFGRMIRIIRVSSDGQKPEPVAAAPAPAAAPIKKAAPAAEGAAAQDPEAEKVYPDVKTYEEAISCLKSLGAKATQLRSVEAAKKFMSQKNVTFPNYNFE